ncbi:hypothetical protein H072_3895 [Dactylellina haptotyla CBS 200.50]|uniref:Uncharacterized protein n=1 Tax=Dactylellina haptotyla (strain CBS 200.50) TaxID=1284197 RepID=S8AG86_DACHA|nr:hypothetical protein H072_3895 [Dactylellina haptotyla CBS 200.50]
MNNAGMTRPFGQLGLAFEQFADGALSESSSEQPLQQLAMEFAAKLRETVGMIQAMDLTTPEGLAQTPFISEKQGVFATEALLGFAKIASYIPRDAPVTSQFLNKPVPIPRDFWDPDDENPQVYTVQKPAFIFPTIDRIATYIQNSGRNLNSPEGIIFWVFAAYRDHQFVELDLNFFEDFQMGMLAIRAALIKAIEIFTGTWATIGMRYNLADGLDSNFYEEMVQMQAYLEHRKTDLDAVTKAFWDCYSSLQIFSGFQPPKPRKKKTKVHKQLIEEVKEEEEGPSTAE